MDFINYGKILDKLPSNEVPVISGCKTIQFLLNQMISYGLETGKINFKSIK